MSYFNLGIFAFVSVYMHAHVCGCPQKTEQGIRSLRAGISGGCGLVDLGAGNQTKVFWKSKQVFLHTEPSIRLHYMDFFFFCCWNFLPSASSKFPFLLLVLFVSFQKLPQMSGNPWWLIIIMRVYLDNQRLWPCGWGMYWLGLYFTMTSMVSHLLWQFSSVSMFVLCPLG